MSNPARLFVVSAPSGAGKTTLCEQLLGQMPKLVRSVSATTRAKRRGERHGIDYFFVSPQRFRRDAARGHFLEHAVVFGNHYGTPRKFVEQQLARGTDVVLSIDVQGALQVRRSFGQRAVFIFIMPPSMAELRKRLRARGTDSARQIKERLAVARREMSFVPRYDYCILNDTIRAATECLRAIITAERARVTTRKR